MEKLIAIPIILICTIRVVSYAVYTIKDNNISGGASLFAMAFLTAASSLYFLLQ